MGKAEDALKKLGGLVTKMENERDHIYISKDIKSEGLKQTLWIYPQKLTAEQNQKLAQAEAILFELAEEVNEESKRKLKGNKN
jgi:hypothetical protein